LEAARATPSASPADEIEHTDIKKALDISDKQDPSVNYVELITKLCNNVCR